MDHPEHQLLRAQIVQELLPFAERLARRFQHRGEPLDDLIQVARLALIKAVDGYDATRGSGFFSYAVPTIVGELKRHFRDKGWGMRVPRALQERRMDIVKAADELTQKLGRIPTDADLAEQLKLTEAEVRDGRNCGRAYAPLSLHTPTGDESGAEIADLLGDVDPAIELVEYRESLRPLIARLPQRQQRILAMRFGDNMTQSQIAAQVDLSQMHVSRLLSQSLSQLRTWFTSES
jgi:RNA polymerase sigma-B factor